MTEPPRRADDDDRLDRLLDRVAAPAPTPDLMARLTGPDALARLALPSGPAPARAARRFERVWLGHAAAAVFGIVIGAGALGLSLAPAGGPVPAPIAVHGGDAPALATAPETMRLATDDGTADLTAGMPMVLALYASAGALDEEIDEVPLD